jgi:hypothetical protein
MKKKKKRNKINKIKHWLLYPKLPDSNTHTSERKKEREREREREIDRYKPVTFVLLAFLPPRNSWTKIWPLF